MIIWHSDTKDCTIVDICVPLDSNVELRHTTKIDDLYSTSGPVTEDIPCVQVYSHSCHRWCTWYNTEDTEGQLAENWTAKSETSSSH